MRCSPALASQIGARVARASERKEAKVSLNAMGELMTVPGLAGLLFGEWKYRFGALESRYGHIVLIGLILGAIGDVCLLGKAKRFFIAGLVSFSSATWRTSSRSAPCRSAFRKL